MNIPSSIGIGEATSKRCLPRHGAPMWSAVGVACSLLTTPAWSQHADHWPQTQKPVVESDQPSPPEQKTASLQAMPEHRVAVPEQHAMAPDMNSMRGLFGPYSMTREASGTSWQPGATPMSGRHFGKMPWEKMAHGFLNIAYSNSDSPRGGGDVFAQSMVMLMARRQIGEGVLGLRAMASLDAATMGKDGYRLLFQTGETANGRDPLIDRQHPHDLFMELSASYAWNFGEANSAFIYAGLPGEPALGPPTFMHRFSGGDNPEAPLGHHWLDATHISFGVLTAGWIWRYFKLEASVFNGHEPDQDRYDIELRRLDSRSVRVSYNPTPNWSMQGSYGELQRPEQLEPEIDIERTTASVMYHRAMTSGQWQTTLAWGSNRKKPGKTTEAYLLESAFVWHDAWTGFIRAERVEKGELFREGEPLHGEIFELAKLTLGTIYDFSTGRSGRFGVGIQTSCHFLPAALEPVYGERPNSWLVFARWKL